ncbi:MAG TPA: Ig-like domain-containing protein [Gemmatimonadales bacterium]|nr:Ig-like domain-containing protein [Gemmatimonadales bacterium]
MRILKRSLSVASFGLLALAAGSCARDDVTGVPGMSASRSGQPNTLRNVIVFATQLPGVQVELAMMNPDGTGRRLITNDPRHDYGYPAISPDGRRIVAVRFIPAGDPPGSFSVPEGLFLMNADGSDQTLLIKRSPFIDFQPTWSPDGTQIAFQSLDEGPFGPLPRIYVIHVDGTGLRRLSPPTDDQNEFVIDEGPSWSPDGRRLVFSRNAQLHLINADGTGFTPVPNAGFGFGAQWSPDGSRIAYGSGSDILVTSVDGSSTVAVTANPDQESGPSWSADGRRLVFERVIAGHIQLVVINADGTGETRVSFGDGEFQPNWSRFPPARSGAGASIAITPVFAKLAPSESRQFTATVRTSNGTLLDHAPVTWSSAGPSVATVTSSGLVRAIDNGTAMIQAVYGGDTVRAEVRVADRVLRNTIVYSTDGFGLFPDFAAVRPDGTGRRRLTSDNFGYGSPDVSPDGRRIVFSTLFSVFIIAADAIGITDGFTSLFFGFDARPGLPTWSPDGSQIAFRADVQTALGPASRIFVVNADGSGLRQLTPDDPDPNQFVYLDDGPTWSPDGTRLVFTRDGVLHVINADGTGLASLGNDDVASEPDWAPDGTRLAYGSPGGIRIRNADGSNPVTVTTVGGDGHPRWSPESQRLVFVRLIDGRSQLFTINADGTAEARLSAGTGQDTGPSWSPVP